VDAITTIGIIEDDDRVRAMLVEAASQCGRVDWVAACCAQARTQLAAGAPDVLLIDVRLPDGDGIDLLPIATVHAHCHCLIVSALGDENTVLRAIENGAAGYLLKDQNPVQIAAAIRDVVNGGAPVSPRLAMFLLNRLRLRPVQDNTNEVLTERERDILDGLARGMSYAELASDRHVSYHTINTHLKTIYRKLAVSSRNQAVYKALHSGLVRLNDSH
jgi:DNA-binding NarL/FixJ family response regulator